MSPRGSTRHKGARWGGPRPSQPLTTMFANTGGHLWRQRGGRGGLPASPSGRGLPQHHAAPGRGRQIRARSPAPGPAVPHRCPTAPQMAGPGWAQRAPFVAGLVAGARGAGSGEEECPRSMPTLPGLTALKSGCHIPSGQPFTSSCGGLVRPPPHSANTNTALNPPAPPSRGAGAADSRQRIGHRDVPPLSCCSIPRDGVGCPTVPGRDVLGSPGPSALALQLPATPRARTRCLPQDGAGGSCQPLRHPTPFHRHLPPDPTTTPRPLPTPPRGHPPRGSPSR